MKKTKLLLVLSALVLAGCDFISITDANKSADNKTENQITENTQNSENNAGNTGENGENTGTNTGTNTGDNTGGSTGGNTGDNTGGSTGGDTGGDSGSATNKIDITDYIPDNTPPYSLSDYTNFTWHDGRTPQHCEDWTVIYGTSVNPVNSAFWTNPNEKVNYSGVEFKKNMMVSSPAFNSWKKVEARFTLWFSSHSSSSYQAANNKPQLLLESYNSQGSLLYTHEINIARSDVPTNNTPKEIKVYITQETMTFFVLKFNNFIPNGSGGYTAILCDAMLRGWPQV